MKSVPISAFLALSLGLAPVGLMAQGPVLTLRQAIDRALGQNPQTAVARANEQEAKAGASLARTALLPQLSFTEDISRGNDPVYVFGSRLRQQRFTQADFALNSLNRPQPLGNFATRFSGGWLVFDSLKTEKEIRRADLNRQSAASASKAVDQALIYRVIGAYQSVLYAQRRLEVAQHEQQTAEALLASAEDHVKAGLAVESDRMAAAVNLAARKQESIAAQGDLDLAWAELREAMAVADLRPTPLNPIEPHAFPESTLDEELIIAAKSRPDLNALGSAQRAQSEAAGAARSNFGPRVSAYGNWEQDRGSFTGAGGNNWVAGAQISLDIFPLGKRAQLAQENAALARANAQVAQAQSQVRLDVSSAHIQRQTAALSQETAQQALDQSGESLRIMKNRYNAGLATITDLLRAEDAERESQQNYWRAVYANAMTYVQLLYAEGTLTPDAAEELE